MNLAGEPDHGASVDALLGGAARERPPAELVELLERAFAAVWWRAHVTLGEVTLTAILDRVVHTASEKYPALSAVKLDGARLRMEGLPREGSAAEPQVLAEVIRTVLVEFLTVLGNQTAEILTPALHAEISRLAVEGGSQEGSGS